MYKIELHLSQFDQVRLEEVRFYSNQSTPLITANGGSPSYCVGSSRNLFNWTVGVRAVTVLLLKAALNEERPANISGEVRTLAASLDYALSKEPSWLIDFFGTSANGTGIARVLFGRRNSERKRPGPVEVFVNDGLLPSDNITIVRNGERANKEQIREMLAMLNPESCAASQRPNRDNSTPEMPESSVPCPRVAPRGDVSPPSR